MIDVVGIVIIILFGFIVSGYLIHKDRKVVHFEGSGVDEPKKKESDSS